MQEKENLTYKHNLVHLAIDYLLADFDSTDEAGCQEDITSRLSVRGIVVAFVCLTRGNYGSSMPLPPIGNFTLDGAWLPPELLLR